MTCRKEVRQLSASEKQDFVDAVFALKRNGTYNQYVREHVVAANTLTLAPGESPATTRRNAAHRGPAFLPWHRDFIRRFERDLQEEVPGLALPYWDWTKDAENPANAPIWSNDFLGGDGDPSQGNVVQTGPFAYDPSDPDTWEVANSQGNPAGRGLQRNFSDEFQTLFQGALDAGSISQAEHDRRVAIPLQTPEDVYGAGGPTNHEGILGLTPYDQSPWRESSGGLRNMWEGFAGFDRVSSTHEEGRIVAPNFHNVVHIWIGGDMAPMTSPNDPVFFLHHCFVDKLWADWQAKYPAEGYRPTASDTNAPSGHRLGDSLQPSGEPISSMLDHRSFSTYDTDVPIVDVPDTSVTFNRIPENETTVRAVVFDVNSCRQLQLEIVTDLSSSAFDAPLGTSRVISPDGETEGRLWLSYTGTTEGATDSETVTVRATEVAAPSYRAAYTDEWTISVTADTVGPQTAAVDLVLDKSGSMALDSGVRTEGGQEITRMDLIKSDIGASPLIELLDADDAIGVVTFDSDADGPTRPATPGVEPAGPVTFGDGRNDAKAVIESLTPDGNTSIGDGIQKAHGRLAGVVGYDTESIVVLTDGHENQPAYIADVASLLTERVFAIGMGTAEQIRPEALSAITSVSGGELLLTGTLGTDDRFRVAKYYLQILAGVRNDQIVVDPEGRLRPGDQRLIPFDVTEADRRIDVVLLAPHQGLFEFVLELPNGRVIEPADAASIPGASYETAEGVEYYRLTLPVVHDGEEVHDGGWQAALRVREDGFRKYLNVLEETDPRGMRTVRTHGVRYNLSAHANSDVELHPTLSQDSFEPGATLTVRASLTEYDLPITGPASVAVDLTRPDETTRTLSLPRIEQGTYETAITASQPGVYRARFKATGKTRRGRAFTRERLLTGSVRHGGDDPQPTSASDPQAGREALCELAGCVLDDDALRERLKDAGIDVDRLAKCLGRYCDRPPVSERPPGNNDDRRPSDNPGLGSLLDHPEFRTVVSELREELQRTE